LVTAGADQPPVWALGGLSTKYETGGRGSTTISGGVGDAGGVSYGSYQMTSANGGTVARFVSQPDFPWRGDFANLAPGSREFSDAWTDIATNFQKSSKLLSTSSLSAPTLTRCATRSGPTMGSI